MKKILKFFLYLIIIFAVGVSGYVIYYKFIAKKGSVDAFNTVPKDALFIIETTDLSKAWTTINNSDLWQHLVETQYFGDINEGIEAVNAFLDSNAFASGLFKGRKLVISGVIASKKDWDFLFSIDLEKGSQTVKTLDKMIDFIDGYKVARNTINVDAGKYEIIQMTDEQDPDFKIFITFADNILLVSFNKAIIEKSLAQLNDNHWNNDKKFVEILQKSPERKLFKIYVKYSNLDDFMQTFLTESDETTEMFANSLAYSILDFDVDENRIILDGFANLDSMSSYVTALAHTAPGKKTAYTIMTDQTAAYVSITFDDYMTFYDNLMDEYAKNNPEDIEDINKATDLLKNVIKIDLQNDFFAWIGNEIALFKIRPLSESSKAEDVAMVIHTNDIDNAKAGMAQIVKQIRKWSPFKFKDYDYKGFTISFLKQKNFFKPFFGKLFEGIEEPYFTFIEDYVVFSNSKELLHQIIDDYVMGRTIPKDEKFQDFIDEFDVKSNIAVFINMPKMYPTLYYFTPASDRSDLKENEQLIESFAHVGFQLSSKNNMFKTTFIAEYDSSAYYEDLTSKLDAQTNNEMFTYYLDTMGFLITLPENLPDGEFVGYYDQENTKKMFEGNVMNGKPDGVWRSYYESGNIESSVTYTDGIPDGIAYFYYDVAANTLRAEVNYVEGKIDGTYKEYYDNGARKATILYDEGLENGDVEFYYRTGDIKIEGKYKNGEKHGKWIYYDQNGEKIAVEKWKKGNKVKEK